MVDFVEERAGEGSFGFDADWSSIFKKGFNFDLVRARDTAVDRRDGEAAFVVFFDFTFSFDDFGVDERSEAKILFVVEVITDDDDTTIEPELGGGHSGR